MTKRYHQLGHEGVTSAVDKLQQEVGGWRREAPPQTRAGAPAAGVGAQGSAWAVSSLQFHCCGSNNSQDWRDSEWIRSGEAGGRVVPDSCCKTVVAGCGQRDHASNIYKVEVGRWGLAETPRALRAVALLCRAWARGVPGCWGLVRGPDDLLPSARTPGLLLQGGCITKLETFIQEHLRIIGAVGLGIACVQVRARQGGPAGAGTRGAGGHVRSCWPHVQVFGMIFTCCLYKSLKLEHY